MTALRVDGCGLLVAVFGLPPPDFLAVETGCYRCKLRRVPNLATLIDMSRSYLLVLGEVTALAWVLAEQRMAFSAQSKSQARALEIGDELLLYTTRGCFHNPTRDRGRVMGVAIVKSNTRELSEPVVFEQRRYVTGCDLGVQGLTPLRGGVDLGSMVPELSAFAGRTHWNMSLRRPLVPLAPRDADILKRELTPLLQHYERYLGDYIEAARRRSNIVRERDASLLPERQL
jgi:hypothetical protein